MQAGIVFWLIETILFICMYGWHYYPINTAELWCDRIALYITWIAFFSWLWSLQGLVDKLLLSIEDYHKNPDSNFGLYLHKDGTACVASTLGRNMGTRVHFTFYKGEWLPLIDNDADKKIEDYPFRTFIAQRPSVHRSL